MPRKYVRAIGKRPYAYYSVDQLNKALLAVHKGKKLRKAAEDYGVPRSTLCRHMHNQNTGKYGRPPVFNENEENVLVKCISLAGDWGFPLTKYDIRCIVKAHLDRLGIRELRFKNNFTGPDWTECFLSRHKNKLTDRLSQNIKRSRAAVDENIINEYFDRLDESMKHVEPHLIINYDETNLTDDPKRQRVVVRRSCRHPDKILDHSKSSTSVMFSATGSGTMLPVYINYKAEHLYDTWTTRGPKGAKYNRTKSGWFTMEIFEDWFKTVVLPYFRKFDKEKPKVLIGDNLASHISNWVIDQCIAENIRFILLPANSTGICQPLDVAFFKPLKTKWSQVLTQWKMKNRGVVPKDTFPSLLKKCLDEMSDKAEENFKAGFKGSGLIPLDRNEVLKRLPQKSHASTSDNSQEWVESFKEFLQESRAKDTQSLRQIKKKKLNVKPGVSVTNVEVIEHQEGQKKTEKKRKISKKKSLQNDSETDTDATISLQDSDCEIDFLDSDEDEPQFIDEDISILKEIVLDPLEDHSKSPPEVKEADKAENRPSTSKENVSPPENMIESPFKTDPNISSDETIKIEPGDFIIARFIYNADTKKSIEKRFIGQVLNAVEDSHVFVKFMRKSNKALNTFVFPQVDDEQLILPENVISKVVPLKVSRGRHLFPKFIEEYSCS